MKNRANQIFESNVDRLHQGTDQLFFWLFLVQWALAIGLALAISPHAWAGKQQSTHPHLWIALFFGALLNALPLALIRLRPGWWGTRHTVAGVQMLWSAIFIHLTGGRIETHFHIFGSLAFIAFYRDWKLLVTATMVVAADHLCRGLLWPESVYGIVNPEWWRFLEHAGWVVFEDIVLFLGCARELGAMQTVAEREAALEETQANTEQQVVARTAELAESMNRFKALVENTNAVPWEFDLVQQQLTYMAPQAATLLHFSPAQLANREAFSTVHPDDRRRVERVVQSIPADMSYAGGAVDYRILTAEHDTLHVHTILSPRDANRPLLALTLDVTKQKKLELELQQAQKLESVGRLASGVAHEINTPVQFVSDSVHFVREAVQSYADVIGKLTSLQDSVLNGAAREVTTAEAGAAKEAFESGNLAYMLQRVPKALDRSLEGLSRITTIVRSMKEFAHPDSTEMASVDLNQAIESTLVIAKSEYKYVAEVETDFGELPRITCHIGDINQAVLNIVVNAAHAIGDQVKGTENKGCISVTTRLDGDHVLVSISDTGGGIPEAARDRIFDPFFTTKEVGKGTGQGLAISRSVVVERHKGQLTFQTELGAGTTFFLRLPVDPATQSAAPTAVAA